MISLEELKHLEDLSRLEFTDTAREKILKDINSMIDFASQIQNADCENKSFIKSMDMKDLREDEPKQGLSQEEVISNAPMKRKGCFAVPRIMD